MYLIKKIYNPEIFQGKYKKTDYFEGWYFKIIDKGMQNALAIIPGIAFGKDNEDSHAFIQIMDSHKYNANYIRYDISDFKYNDTKFEIEIDKNYFSNKEISLDIDTLGVTIKGELLFENIITYPKNILRPGIMGPFTYVPFMECYHGIVNIHHDIMGQICLFGNNIDFTKGYGYIEKDWGRSFPEAWIWLQSNHFAGEDISLMFSVAKIPWFGKYFLGFISFIRIMDKTYLFSTYSKAKLIKLNYADSKLTINIEDIRYKLEIDTLTTESGVLRAPKNGLMKREILESITAVVKVRLSDIKGQTIYEGEGSHTGLEIVEDIFKYYNE